MRKRMVESLDPSKVPKSRLGGVRERLSGFMDFALSAIVCSVPNVWTSLLVLYYVPYTISLIPSSLSKC